MEEATAVRKCKICKTIMNQPLRDGLHFETSGERFTVWRRGRDSGCPFCTLVVNIVEHAFLTSLRYDRKTVKELIMRVKSALVPVGQKEQLILQWLARGQEEDAIFVSLTTHGPSDGMLAPLPGIIDHGGSPECLVLARKWLLECKTRHPSCYSNTTSFVPKRLLDISATFPKLVVDLPRYVPYVALSHCWGGLVSLQTTKDTYRSHQTGMDPDLFPKTFQQAFQLANYLGYHYVWIDCLCIIQEDEEDWEKQASEMAKVYGNADVVLAATTASSAKAGFFHTRERFFESSVTFETETAGSTTARYRMVPCRGHYPIGPLDNRGWAVQEKLVARRYLAFESQQLTWECHEKSESESQYHIISQAKYHVRNLDSMLQDCPREDLCVRWRDHVVRPFTRAKLTHESDRLVALSAVAARFQELNEGTYLVGLWKESMIRDLTWGNDREENRVSCTRPQGFCAPTWSWISVNNLEYFHVSELRLPYDFGAEVARFVDCEISHLTTNQFGSVAEARLRLRSKLKQVTLNQRQVGAGQESSIECLEIPAPDNYTCIDIPFIQHETANSPATASNVTEDAKIIDHEPAAQTQTVSLLILQANSEEAAEWFTEISTELAEQHSLKKCSSIFCNPVRLPGLISFDCNVLRQLRGKGLKLFPSTALVLRAVEGQSNCYERVGIWMGLLSEEWHNWEEREVVLI
ncbi:heterokaryon incompatibility protein-domain-containing protein [Xylariaceae sp. FL1019]|nr:heterokaryon incompatibility protein-domain-containing protein [Xylariaceae sp. FL1019]